jgi:hypothetical protein
MSHVRVSSSDELKNIKAHKKKQTASDKRKVLANRGARWRKLLPRAPQAQAASRNTRGMPPLPYPKMTHLFHKVQRQKQGFVFVSGPLGSNAPPSRGRKDHALGSRVKFHRKPRPFFLLSTFAPGISVLDAQN